ncbi:hypothetical protein FTX61_18795 [Nitriliruptoraceae bacterium ZYF776]|nr:hypothetical protein [Profundirhabdus halotolerans]
MKVRSGLVLVVLLGWGCGPATAEAAACEHLADIVPGVWFHDGLAASELTRVQQLASTVPPGDVQDALEAGVEDWGSPLGSTGHARASETLERAQSACADAGARVTLVPRD